ncbi:MAG TPA: TIR domain-containing protein [Blastocatellia bacterium]|nr:TIR domain-containing protein [Blastocatellia bacterium]
MKPSLFIASSSEAIRLANAVQQNLRRQVEATVWDQGVFGLSSAAIDSLIETLKQSDFGVFIFSPDDIVRIRGQESQVARDNVVFELGLFIGHLGKERCFILVPDDSTDFHLPTDLAGITPATYETDRRDKNIRAATGPACEEIRDAIRKQGFLTEERAIPEGAPDKAETPKDQAVSKMEGVQASVGALSEDDNDKETWAKAFVDRDYIRALALLEKELGETQDEDKRWDLRLWIGTVKGFMDVKTGAEYFENLISERPNDKGPYANLAYMYRRRAHYDKALAEIERGLLADADKESLLDLKADILDSQGNFGDAESLLKEAMEANPTYENHLITLVDLY